ncbi:Kelch-like protein 12 [Sparganum proliferum]
MGSLMKSCINLMQEQFRSLVYTDLFLRLPADTVLTLLRNDNLSVDSEEAVFEAISSWVRAGDKECDNQRLRLHAPEMLKEVRWCQTTVQFRSRLVDSHPMFRDSNSCARFMAQVGQWMCYSDKDTPPCPFNRRRRPPPTICFVFGKDEDQDRWSVLRFDPQLEREERISDMEKREWASYSLVGGELPDSYAPPLLRTCLVFLFVYFDQLVSLFARIVTNTHTVLPVKLPSPHSA